MDQLLRWGLNAGLLASLAVVPCAAIWMLLTWRSRTGGRTAAPRSAGIDVALLGSIALIVVVALRPGMGLDPGSEQWNWVPFRDLARSLSGPAWAVQIAAANLVGNALLFLPFGVCLGIRFGRASAWSLVLVVAALSIGVEIGQALTATGRLSDVTDVLMNTAGGLAGIATARIIGRRRAVREVDAASLRAQPPHR
jgi:glycopeptide antibiotics resistance protein